MKKAFIIIMTFFTLAFNVSAQSTIVKDFKEVCDSLNTLLIERTEVKGVLGLKSIMKRGTTLDFYFTESLGDYPFRTDDSKWFRTTLKSLFPEKYSKYTLGNVYSRNVSIERLEVSELGFSGSPMGSRHKTSDPKGKTSFVTRLGEPEYAKGLDGRTIAVWQSHGLYFAHSSEGWIWQRPCLFQTVEDMYTQGYVLPYLVPMLENAGAYVMLPRERDTQIHEVIADNEATLGGRGTAVYTEKGNWKGAGTGFADIKEFYEGYDNPFTMGTARECSQISTESKAADATAEWRPDIPERGEYAVYVSYKSLPESTTAAHYTVHHLGGETEFVVNQKISGSLWVYLGTFEFDKGNSGYVSLSNRTPEGYKHSKGSKITADAVKFGGGMGNIARKVAGSEEPAVVSGAARSVEGARYWLQWAGVDKSIYSPNELEDDYKDDYMSRGDWVNWISGGSYMNPKTEGKGVPVDLSMGFHTDAGVTPDDAIIGTLAIYTLKSENKDRLPGGESRMTSREFADIVQSQIVNDIQEDWNPDWNRRAVWDRGYRESRTPSCPSMLLELLSHQNFADMKYGLDPEFRFSVSRSIYKGMLKYLSRRYGVPYVVQPLPVKSIGIRFGEAGNAILSWEVQKDIIEPTADAKGFLLYTRTEDGAFDTGRVITDFKKEGAAYSIELPLTPGEIKSYRIVAYNEGGKSFPSETVSIGLPENGCADKTVLVVNNFDRISGPAFIDTPSYAGFDGKTDSGVADGKDITFIGDMYQFRRNMEWISNANPGFGGSYDDYAGKKVPGNTFDYAYAHGKAILKAGHPFCSCSNEIFCSDSLFRQAAWTVDLICGKQVTTVTGNDSTGTRFSVFPYEMQNALRSFTANGGNVLVSGAYIGTDIWDQIYPYEVDKAYRTVSQKFAKEVLGYKWIRSYAGRSAEVEYECCETVGTEDAAAGSFYNSRNTESYCVECPDGIAPASKSAKTIMRYSDTGIAAAVAYQGNGYRTVCVGFPIETFVNDEGLDKIISITLQYFKK